MDDPSQHDELVRQVKERYRAAGITPALRTDWAEEDLVYWLEDGIEGQIQRLDGDRALVWWEDDDLSWIDTAELQKPDDLQHRPPTRPTRSGSPPHAPIWPAWTPGNLPEGTARDRS